MSSAFNSAQSTSRAFDRDVSTCVRTGCSRALGGGCAAEGVSFLDRGYHWFIFELKRESMPLVKWVDVVPARPVGSRVSRCVFPWKHQHGDHYSCSADGETANRPWCAFHRQYRSGEFAFCDSTSLILK